jgi:hypothetical protein
LFDAADLDIQERLQALSRPSVSHLARLETALTAWAIEHRAPRLPRSRTRPAYRYGLATCYCRILSRPASSSAIRKAA